ASVALAACAVALGACVVALGGAGCSAVLDFHECNTTADCASRGATLYCNPDHQCIDPSPCYISEDATAAGTPLVIAGLYLESKPSDGPNDHAIRQAVDLATIELNDQMVPVRHVACDTGGDVTVAQHAFDLAVEQFKAVAVVGPNTSDELLALAADARARGVAVVSPAASAAAIADIPDDNLIWRTCGSDNLQAKVLATLVPPGDSLDVLWVTHDSYTEGLQKAFCAAADCTNATPIQFDTGHAADAVAQMNGPQYAVLIADYDAPGLVAALAGAPGQSMTQYLMTDSALTPTLWGTGPFDFTFLTRIRGTAPALPAFSDPSGPVYAAFDASYRAQWNELPSQTAFVANAYDATYAIAIGAAAAAGGPVTGSAIAGQLARMSDASGTVVHVGPAEYQAGVNALIGGGDIDLVGTSGPIDWDAKGDVITAPIEVWQVADDGTGMPTFKVLSTTNP
ncbi:MAG TPA: ABC transporter substrate-binding protein, partial [Ideonella sp.]|nr:ABC transporter substrate-binding protein [Ideonella sp.]